MLCARQLPRARTRADAEARSTSRFNAPGANGFTMNGSPTRFARLRTEGFAKRATITASASGRWRIRFSATRKPPSWSSWRLSSTIARRRLGISLIASTAPATEPATRSVPNALNSRSSLQIAFAMIVASSTTSAVSTDNTKMVIPKATGRVDRFDTRAVDETFEHGRAMMQGRRAQLELCVLGDTVCRRSG